MTTQKKLTQTEQQDSGHREPYSFNKHMPHYLGALVPHVGWHRDTHGPDLPSGLVGLGREPEVGPEQSQARNLVLLGVRPSEPVSSSEKLKDDASRG